MSELERMNEPHLHGVVRRMIMVVIAHALFDEGDEEPRKSLQRLAEGLERRDPETLERFETWLEKAETTWQEDSECVVIHNRSMAWRVLVNVHEGNDGGPQIELEWGWTAGMSAEEITALSPTAVRGRERILLSDPRALAFDLCLALGWDLGTMEGEISTIMDELGNAIEEVIRKLDAITEKHPAVEDALALLRGQRRTADAYAVLNNGRDRTSPPMPPEVSEVFEVMAACAKATGLSTIAMPDVRNWDALGRPETVTEHDWEIDRFYGIAICKVCHEWQPTDEPPLVICLGRPSRGPNSIDVKDPRPSIDERLEAARDQISTILGGRPDFHGFLASLRAEIEGTQAIHRRDETGQARSDVETLARLVEHVERTGKSLGLL